MKRTHHVNNGAICAFVFSFLALVLAPYITKADTWSPVASMDKGRNSHTATRLLDGRVLVAGGTNNGGGNFVEKSSEIYDAATDTWSAGGDLQNSRWFHTATLLTDGRVLIVGGIDNTGFNNTAEIYDPPTNSWTSAQSMSVGRIEHAATLLSDGRVLVTGGQPPNSSLPHASAEIYDPATDTWSSATSMATGHWGHTATRLNDGRVLVVAGGLSDACCSSQVEIYNPTTNTWTAAAPGTGGSNMIHQSATLLTDGRVLTVGGAQFLGGRIYNPTTNTWSSTSAMELDAYYGNHAMLLSDGRVMVVGGDAPAVTQYYQAAVEFYNPVTDSWTVASSMSIGRRYFSATLLADERVLVAGGGAGGGDSVALSAAEIYDLEGINEWAPIAAMSQTRAEHTATRLNDGRVLVAGGKLIYRATFPFSSTDTAAEAEIFNPASGNWSSGGSMASRRARHTATILGDGRVLVVGGWDTVTTYATAEFYNPATNTWSPAPSLATARREHTATRLADGRVLVTGGTNTSITNPTQLNSGEIYDPRTNSWSPVPAMNSTRRLHTATLLGDRRVLVVGGQDGSGAVFGEVYNPATNSWTVTDGDPIGSRKDHTATLLWDGRVLVAGGQIGGGIFASAVLYNPGTNGWSPAGSMSFPRSEHTATRTPGGKVLVTGGFNIAAFLASANIYDPSTNSWFYEDTMHVDRALHTATLLQDGRLLVVGGTHAKVDSNSLASGELFGDPFQQVSPGPAKRDKAKNDGR